MCTGNIFTSVQAKTLPNMTDVEWCFSEQVDVRLLFHKCSNLKRLCLLVDSFPSENHFTCPVDHPAFLSSSLTHLELCYTKISRQCAKNFAALSNLIELRLCWIRLPRLATWSVLGHALSKTSLKVLHLSVNIFWVRLVLGILAVKLDWLQIDCPGDNDPALSKREFAKFSENIQVFPVLPNSFYLRVCELHNVNGVTVNGYNFFVCNEKWRT